MESLYCNPDIDFEYSRVIRRFRPYPVRMSFSKSDKNYYMMGTLLKFYDRLYLPYTEVYSKQHTCLITLEMDWRFKAEEKQEELDKIPLRNKLELAKDPFFRINFLVQYPHI